MAWIRIRGSKQRPQDRRRRGVSDAGGEGPAATLRVHGAAAAFGRRRRRPPPPCVAPEPLRASDPARTGRPGWWRELAARTDL